MTTTTAPAPALAPAPPAALPTNTPQASPRRSRARRRKVVHLYALGVVGPQRPLCGDSSAVVALDATRRLVQYVGGVMPVFDREDCGNCQRVESSRSWRRMMTPQGGTR